MKRLILFISTLSIVPLTASDRVIGDEVRTTSPKGVPERCVRLARMPGATYRKDDSKDEEAYTAINFYDPSVALSPKTWSTSPGMVVYDISEGPFAGAPDRFEKEAGQKGKGAGEFAKDDLALFKCTMNREGTSATFSTSSLLYYHFSRYFDMEVRVPVAVWRSMDKDLYLSRVAQSGLEISGRNPAAKMNHEAWRVLVEAAGNPVTYTPTNDLFTTDRSAIHGVMLSNRGDRYGPEVNGTRQSGWGAGQNRDFQETPPFLALRSAAPLKEAIAEGLGKGQQDSQIVNEAAELISPQQMAYWMREISEIVLLDFIFSQQDRVGNIDFAPYHYWIEAGEVKRKRAKEGETVEGDVPKDAIILKRTMLNDNDAGGKVQFANFAKSTGMLEKLRHFHAGTYRQLMALDADFRSQGLLHHYLSSTFGLEDSEVRQIVKNTSLAAGILRESRLWGDLRFDLDPERFFLEGEVGEEVIPFNEAEEWELLFRAAEESQGVKEELEKQP
ncbi:MAG: hypothetical protein ABL994_04055 [Verrucomicrobiales bacterium]